MYDTVSIEQIDISCKNTLRKYVRRQHLYLNILVIEGVGKTSSLPSEQKAE